MAKYSQADRPIRIDTPLGPDVLLLTGFSGVEGLSQLFRISVNLVSTVPDIAADDLANEPVTITMVDSVHGPGRRFNGFVSRFTQGRKQGDLVRYTADVVPWPWFLTLSRDMRIFQDRTVLEIIEETFIDQGFHDYDIRCSGVYAKREYCVQYRESHFAFVSRLMEEEGIFYFFEHTDDRHVLVLADHNSSMPSQPVPTAQLRSKKAPLQEVITTFLHESARHVGRTTLRDWDPLQPFFDLETSVAGNGRLEYYDYPAGYSDLEVGDHYARMRQESIEAAARVIHGAGRIRSFESGRRFTLTGHYRADLNREFVVTQVQHRCRAGSFRSDETASKLDYRNHFTCIPGDVPFRPRQFTPRPTVHGPHTAIVVGQPGEDVRTDQHGRVEVRFHWDRRNPSGDARSCMVRVASFWAGKGWGALHLPRPGHEVIVDFLEGNPDRPLITGSVYNDANRPAWTLPGHANISGVRSRSSPDGTADQYNEIILDDRKGKERVAIHAERSFHLSTEASEYRRIGSNSVSHVRGARSVMVEGQVDLTFEVETEGMEPIPYTSAVGDYLGVLGDRVVEVGKLMRYIAGEGHLTELLEGANHHTLLREGDHTIAFSGPGSQRINVLEGDQVIDVFEGDQKILLKDGDHVVDARAVRLKASGAFGGVVAADAERAVLVTAGDSITLQVGETQLKLTPEGVFINNAPLIELNALVKATTSAPIVEVAATMQASFTADVMAEVSATGLVNVRGGGVVIN